MVLNYIWIAFFLIAFVVALFKLVIGGDTEVFTNIINASFASAKSGFEISLGLTGILSLGTLIPKDLHFLYTFLDSFITMDRLL